MTDEPKALTPQERLRHHFADDMIEELLGRLEEGESLSSICRDPRMPAYRTVYNWLEEDTGPEGFGAQFRAARARGLDTMADDCVDIADEAPPNPEGIAKARLKIDTRLRLLGKWARSKYGEGVDITSGGEKLPSLDDDAAARRLEEILSRAKGRKDGDPDVV